MIFICSTGRFQLLEKYCNSDCKDCTNLLGNFAEKMMMDNVIIAIVETQIKDLNDISEWPKFDG